MSNTRVVIDAKGEVIEEKSYYPFGLEIQELAYKSKIDAKPYEYAFGGKEVWDDLGLGWSNFGARGLDKETGRWNAQDPLQEKFVGWSPYNYCFNNPAKFIDRDGKQGNEIGWMYMTLRASEKDPQKKEVLMKQYQRSANKTFFAGLSAVVGGAVLGNLATSSPLFAEGAQELMLTAEATPEMVTYLAVRFPRLFKYAAAIAGELAPAGAVTGGMSKEGYYVKLFNLILQNLQGDTTNNKQETQQTENSSEDDNTENENTSQNEQNNNNEQQQEQDDDES